MCSLQIVVLILMIVLFCLGKGAAEKYKLEVGENAIAEQIVPCWDCRYCKRGGYNMCKNIIILLSSGGYAWMHTC